MRSPPILGDDAAMTSPTLQQDYGRLHATHVAALVRHLIECRRACGGDLDLFLVLTIIGERSFTPRNAPTLSYDEWASAPVNSVRAEQINLQSIADYSGIPRETVRRKLERLVNLGWVERDANGFYTATEVARASLGPLTQSGVRYLETMKEAFGGT